MIEVAAIDRVVRHAHWKEVIDVTHMPPWFLQMHCQNALPLVNCMEQCYTRGFLAHASVCTHMPMRILSV